MSNFPGPARRVNSIASALPRIVQPLQEFLATESAGGLLLLLAAAAALIWANVPGDTYSDFWGTHVGVDFDVLHLDESLAEWVNEGLMAVFFFVVGLEIKREIFAGELADPRRAALPVAAALGGMILPAIIYLGINANGDEMRGWGIPMATDIAFAVGVLALLGRRAPVALKVFLLALAIVDDLGAIVVIAVFYSDAINFAWLAAFFALMALIPILGRSVRDVVVYVIIGSIAWIAIKESGVHATIAGVALGLLTPMAPHRHGDELEHSIIVLSDEFHDQRVAGTRESEELRHAALRDLEEVAREGQPVLDRLEHALHPWTSYVIIPIFALANAGVALSASSIRDAVDSPISAGVVFGLVLGKPLGILLFSWLAVRIGVATLPSGIGWIQLAGVSVIAGIGFTVSLFIAELAFPSAALVEDAKMGILAGSAIMATVGYLVMRLLTRPSATDEAEVPESEPVPAAG